MMEALLMKWAGVASSMILLLRLELWLLTGVTTTDPHQLSHLSKSCVIMSTCVNFTVSTMKQEKKWKFLQKYFVTISVKKRSLKSWAKIHNPILSFGTILHNFTIKCRKYLHLCCICLQSKRLMPSQQWLLSSFLDFLVPCSPHLSIHGLLVVMWLLAMNINDTWSQLLPARVTHNSVLSSVNIIQSKHWTLSIIKCY